MAEQQQLDGIAGWGSVLLDSFGSRLADNVAPPEKTADLSGTEELSGQPTPGQQFAGGVGGMVNNKTLLLIGGGVLAVVAIVAVMGND